MTARDWLFTLLGSAFASLVFVVAAARREFKSWKRARRESADFRARFRAYRD